jgi:hypothetical protein
MNRNLLHSLYFSPFLGFVSFGGIGDGKTDIAPSIAGSDTIRASMNQPVGKMIEGAAETLDSVSKDQRDLDWWLLNGRQVVMQASGIRIALDVDLVWVGREESLASDLEVLDVMIGPFDFRPY